MCKLFKTCANCSGYRTVESNTLPPCQLFSVLRADYRTIQNRKIVYLCVACIDTSTPSLFVELYLGVCGNMVKNQRGDDGLSISKYNIAMRPLQAKERLTLVLPIPYSLKPAART
jgi:hypothetical protein